MIPSREDAAKAQSVFRDLGVSVPSGSRVLYFERFHGLDETVRIKLVFASRDLSELITGLGFRESMMSKTVRHLYRVPRDPNEWNPGSIQDYTSAEMDLKNNEVLRVLIEQGDDAESIAFIEWFSK